MLYNRNKSRKVLKKIELKRAERTLDFKERKRLASKSQNENNKIKNQEQTQRLNRIFGKDYTYNEVLNVWLPTNLNYLLNCNRCEFSKYSLSKDKIFNQPKPLSSTKILYVPQNFSIIQNPAETFSFWREAILTLLFGRYKSVFFSYRNCTGLDVGAQVILDIIKQEAIIFINKCRAEKLLQPVSRAAFFVGITDVLSTPRNVQKIIASIGSLAVQSNMKLDFPDIIPYRLCSFKRDSNSTKKREIEQKDIDTTNLAMYVVNSLAKFNKQLTGEKLDDLCTIIGEILINAEEHATTHHRFSIGYFQEHYNEGKHSGVFRLVILNFGKTIYEKFTESKNPNVEIISRMKELSEQYTRKRLFTGREFEEENLWTLYALQEGVSSIPDRRRGNGSIQFIDSFFSIKGDKPSDNEKSKMTILSGHTKIVFDGTYRIANKLTDGHNFKIMAFNTSGNLEDPPDKKYVQYVENYFPGTIISARILLNDDDFINNDAD